MRIHPDQHRGHVLTHRTQPLPKSIHIGSGMGGHRFYEQNIPFLSHSRPSRQPGHRSPNESHTLPYAWTAANESDHPDHLNRASAKTSHIAGVTTIFGLAAGRLGWIPPTTEDSSLLCDRVGPDPWFHHVDVGQADNALVVGSALGDRSECGLPPSGGKAPACWAWQCIPAEK